MFFSIVQYLNEAMEPQVHTNQLHTIQTTRHVQILDICGFEIRQNNDFEQLIINYANERIQQYFVDRRIMNKQNEYLADGIHMDYYHVSNTITNSFESKHGIIHTIEELSRTHNKNYAQISYRLSQAQLTNIISNNFIRSKKGNLIY